MTTRNCQSDRSPSGTRALGTGALVLFSGGQDSTTCLFWAKRQFEQVNALAMDYGQKHRIELTQAKEIAQYAGVPLHTMDIRGTVGGSALTEHHLEMGAAHPVNPALPSSFVPARNALFLTLAAGYAFNQGIQDLVAGMCETDDSGYPDCRAEFITSMETTMSLALDQPIRIHTPLMHLTKAQTWKLAKDLDVLEIVRDLSHTDYNGDRTQKNEWGYGRLDNSASVLRAQGYEEAKRRGWL
jgi:7-cyano-7-deazaguanine synthase